MINPNPNAKRVLCFGDSNTLGRDAKRKFEDGVKTRLPVGVRWTSLLQAKLGSEFEVIEEGVGARTTDIDDPTNPGRNGLEYLSPCLKSHVPLDIVILMLGTNDLKERFSRSARDVAEANRRLIRVIKEEVPESSILLVSPILVNEANPVAKEKYFGAGEKSRQLAAEMEVVAQQEQCAFLDLAQFVEPSKYDGVHIDEKDQEKVANTIAQKIADLS